MNENEFEHTRRPRDAEAVERGLIHDAATAAVEGGFGGAAWTLGNLAVQDAWDKITPPKEGGPIVLPPGVGSDDE
jgi:hypothetical protein